MANEGVDLKLNRVLADPTSVPKSMHRIMWTRVGDMIVLEVGYFDLPDLRVAINQKKEESAKPTESSTDVNFFVTDRFFVTPSVVKDICNDLDGLLKDLRKQNLLPPENGGH